MSPEEKYNTHLWYVLKKLKEAILYAIGKEGVATYLLAPNVIVAGEAVPSHEQEVAILNQLQEQSVIKVKEVLPKESDSDYMVRLDYTSRVLFTLIEPTFSEWYEKHGDIKPVQPLAVITEDKLLPLPTDPEVIDEYLWVVNRIDKERQTTPNNEPIAYPVPKRTLIAKGVPTSERENSILKILEQHGLLRITQKTMPYQDPLGLNPYENSQRIRAVEILDEYAFQLYRDSLLKSQQANRALPTIQQPIMRVGNGKNPYQPIIDVIDVLLRKIEITPPNRLTQNQIKVHISETPLPQTIVGIEELGQILNTLQKSGAVGRVSKEQGVVSPGIKMPSQDNKDVGLYGATFFISSPNKELLQLQRKNWSGEDSREEQAKSPIRHEEEHQPVEQQTDKPFAEVKGGKGYLKFQKQRPGIEVGGPATRTFRLLQCLCEPFGVQKTTEAVFEAIKLPKDAKDSRLLDYSPQKHIRIVEIIRNTIKELQKKRELKKLRCRFDGPKRTMWLELEG